MADLAGYRALVGSRVRSQLAYRSSFALDVLGNIGIGLTEFAEVYVLFHNVDALGGLGYREALLVFALANIAFSLADFVFGHIDELPDYLRAGTLDVLLLRPRPVLAQLVLSDVSLRRLGRTLFAVVLLAVSLSVVPDWTLGKVLLAVLTPLTGFAIYGALFVGAAASQFWLTDGREFSNAFTYGSSYAGAYPASLLHVALRAFFAFVVPAAFCAYLPALVLLDVPGPAGLPAWLGWCTPVVVVAAWSVALLGWRAGLRRYTGGGG